MGRAKDIIVKVIPSKAANDFVKKNHYSGKVVQNSKLHFGCFLDGKLHGVMSYGFPIDKRKMLGLVSTDNKTEQSKWNEFLELNRMAFDDYLPKYSESRAISVSFKLIKKNAPQIKYIISFADSTQCGDGTIYRASGFKLTMIKKNTDLYLLPNGEVKHSMTIKTNKKIISKYGSCKKYLEKEHKGFSPINGFQLRYIYLIDKKSTFNCKILPFSEIDKQGAGMYKGEKITLQERRALSDEVDSNSNS
ncbi:MAG: hypothetical protein P8I94_04370 [Emcibacteraceae bacterium]|nr:hypothetical protein [Emcibacteraceae bacterium]